MPSSSVPMDFAPLLSGGYRAARLTQLNVVRKTLRKEPQLHVVLEEEEPDDDEEEKHKQKPQVETQQHISLLHDLAQDEEEPPTQRPKTLQEMDEAMGRLALQLASKTPAYTRHLQDSSTKIVDDSDLQRYLSKQHPSSSSHCAFAPDYHEVNLGDWELKINWGGCANRTTNSSTSSKNKKNETTTTTTTIGMDTDMHMHMHMHTETTTASSEVVTSSSSTTATGTTTTTSIISTKPIDAETLLQERRNPYLDQLSLSSRIGWSKADLSKIRKFPVLMELGVTGQSIASHLLPSQRPIPCIKSQEYQNRWAAKQQDGLRVQKGSSLRMDKEKTELDIQQRQALRSKMEKEKTKRILDAHSSLGFQTGKGRTITSSLMGPGGTERTGRPSRQVTNASHETEYIEQLDMVTNHTLFRDWAAVALRQYHRPKLPRHLVKPSLIWQCQIRYQQQTTKNKTATGGGGGGDNASSYQTMIMGTHAGAVSKAKLRSETDLSPTEGHLVLLEYCEERPPIPLTKGMASKIVTYYRGDKSRCPVSAGGGDRPTRRKRTGGTQNEQKKESSSKLELAKPPKLVGPNLPTNITDWIGKSPKKTKKENAAEDSIDILPEGVTEILHPKVHGPFMGEITNGESVTGLISNLFVAPLFRHEPETTDFLMILGKSGASIPGRHESMGVVLRELPTSVYTVGQTEPRTRVYAPNTQGEKNFQHPFVSYQIAKVLARAEQRGGLEFDEIREKVLPSLQLSAAHFRNRLKPVAVYDKNTQLWTTKSIGADYDDNHDPYPGVDMLGKSIPPEGVAAYEVTCAAQRRLRDLGIQKLFVGAHAVSSVGVTMVYLTGQVAAAKKLSKKAKSNLEIFQKTSQKMSKQNQMVESSSRIKFFELAAEELAKVEKSLLKRHEVAKFIYQELLLAPWHLTGEFIDVHRKGEGIGMMKLTGLGDPSGKGEGFSFIREIDTKPTKTPVQGEADQMKKITGTGDDLRKLNMGEMAAILRKYGMDEKVIKRLQRWDRVHMIRDLSTKAAADGNLDGYGRFARGEKMKLSEQKQRYRDRIQMIWKREIAALSIDSDGVRAAGVDSSGAPSDDLDEAAEAAAEQKKKEDAAAKDDSDSSDSDFDDDLENDLAMNMMEDANAAQSIVADQAQAGGGGDISRDEAIQLAALKRQREEERAAQEGITLNKKMTPEIPMHDRKVIRKRITRTYPDGRQVTTFKFIVHPEEVGEIMARLGQQDSEEHTHKTYDRPEYQADDKPLGHAMFEDDDDFIFTTTGRSSGSRRAMGRRQRGGVVKGQRRRKDFQFGKLKTKVSLDQKLKKRKRAEEEEELYQPTSKLKGTSNRKERGSIRQKKPHVIFADRLEAIRGMIESRPLAGPFLKPVNMRNYPDYYVVISDPIDLATIRDKIQKSKYQTADAFLKDFLLMKSNAIKFNGKDSPIAKESSDIYDFVEQKIKECQGELTHLEQAVKEQMNSKPAKKKRKLSPKASRTNAVSPSFSAAGVSSDSD